MLAEMILPLKLSENIEPLSDTYIFYFGSPFLLYLFTLKRCIS
jgi:hypothetical protein